MSTNNNAINIQAPFGSSFGGTGVSVPTDHGIMVSNGTDPMSSIVLDSDQVLLGLSGNAPIPTTLVAGSQITFTQAPGSLAINSTATSNFTWNVIESPVPDNTVNMQPSNGYLTTTTDMGDRISFKVPSTADGVQVGDEFRIGSWNSNSVGFILTGNGSDRFWFGNGTLAPNATEITVSFVSGRATPAAFHLVCVDNSNPGSAQFLILSNFGNFTYTGGV